MAAEQEKAINLEDDGVSEEFFKLLWCKDELNFGPQINIPDTVIFKYGQPHVWYFTNKNGKIKRKNRSNLIASKIEDVFKSYALGYDVIATFISCAIEKDPETGKYAPSVARFFNKETLADFLYKRDKNSHGILQRFVEPKGTKNEIIRAIWSPKVCLLERAENIHHLHDMRYGIFERCVTYEGPEYYIESSPLRGAVLAGQIQKVCENVVAHIAEVTYAQKQITRIVVNFKVDSREKLWLLYTTSIRCGDEVFHGVSLTRSMSSKTSLINIDNVVSLPAEVNLNPVASYDEIVPKSRIRCLSCNTETLNDLRHPVPYKSIIKHYEHVLQLTSALSGSKGKGVIRWPPDPEVVDAAGGVGFGCLANVSEDDMRKNVTLDLSKPLDTSELRIPPILRYLHPKLSPMAYTRCRKDPLFAYKTVMVCEPCYLVYAEFATMVMRMGKDLTQILKPDPNAVDAGPRTASTMTRPSSADWRALSTVNRSSSAGTPGGFLGRSGSPSREFQPSKNHLKAKESAIGIRSSEVKHQPTLPKTIHSVDEVAPIFTAMTAMEYQQKQEMFGKTVSPADLSLQRSISGSMGGLGTNFSAGSLDPDNVAAIAAERERHFYKEVARNPQLRDQHPLMHLINAQQKLAMVNKQSGVNMSHSASKSEGLFSPEYGKQSFDKFEKFSSYKQALPYVINGEVIPASKYKKLQKLKQMKKHKRIADQFRQENQIDALKASASDSMMNMNMDTPSLTGPAPMSPEPSAFGNSTASLHRGTHLEESVAEGNDPAAKHRQFLQNALRGIEAELEKSAPFTGTAATADTKPNSALKSGTARSAAGGGGMGKRSSRASSRTGTGSHIDQSHTKRGSSHSRGHHRGSAAETTKPPPTAVITALESEDEGAAAAPVPGAASPEADVTLPDEFLAPSSALESLSLNAPSAPSVTAPPPIAPLPEPTREPPGKEASVASKEAPAKKSSSPSKPSSKAGSAASSRTGSVIAAVPDKSNAASAVADKKSSSPSKSTSKAVKAEVVGAAESKEEHSPLTKEAKEGTSSASASASASMPSEVTSPPPPAAAEEVDAHDTSEFK